MWYTVHHDGVSIGTVDLPVGLLAAAHLEPHPGYATIEAVVRRATMAFLHLGLFGAAVPLLPPISAEALAMRRTLGRAARLQIELTNEQGNRVETRFVNLLESPLDGGVVVVASFIVAPAMMGSPVSPVERIDGQVTSLRHNHVDH